MGIQQLIPNLLDWVEHLGFWAPLAFIIIYNLATILFIPGSLLTLGAGIIFGVIWGSIYVSIGSVMGATFAFLIGRYFTRDWVARKLENYENFQAIDQAVGEEGWKIVGLTRLSPIFPFNLLNYAFGLTNVSLKDYFLASWIGMLPGTILYVYVGSLVGSLAQLGTAERSRTLIEWLLYGIGLMATLIVTLYITRIAQNALNQKIK
ncbi:MAG: TVP38/TMEM64 family protein [Planktothrix sp.]|uniref:TVP38/TMEM64 family protein n=1 Tax=Planktothrix sp. TaxID=3088171 RepID=UPI0038D3E08A